MKWSTLAAGALTLALIGGCRDAPVDERAAGAPAPAATVTTPASAPTRADALRVTDGEFDPQAIYERESPGVVTIIATGVGSGQGEGGLGSGFVVSGDGEIATNAHVVTRGDGKGIEAADKVYVRFADRNQVGARVVGFDPFADVALLKIDADGLRLHPLAFGDAARVVVGEPVAAIGSPFGEERSLSVGVVSATDRSIRSLTGFDTTGAIQTDAAINSGNSGGPLLDGRGEVLGINSQIRTRSGEGSGVGFAVPVDVVRRALDQIREDGQVRYAYLGVSTRLIYPQLADRFDLPEQGVWVQEVVPGGPAAKAGLRAGSARELFQETRWSVGGDVVTKVDGRLLERDSDLGRALSGRLPGDRVRVEINREGTRRELVVTLGERPLELP